MKSFARLSNAERGVYIEQAAAELGLPKGSVEKDFWVCWTLRLLFELPSWGASLTFKGGTSLSKGFGLIKRFSEDIDLVIERDRLGFGGDHSPENAPSNNQRKKRLEALRSACVAAVQKELLPAIQAAVEQELGVENVERVSLDASDPQTILFTYPSAFAESLLYLSPIVKIEIGARSDTEPCALCRDPSAAERPRGRPRHRCRAHLPLSRPDQPLGMIRSRRRFNYAA